MNPNLREKIKNFVLQDVKAGTFKKENSIPVWKKLRDTGSEIWLDTGDMEAASELWCKEMSALTTNNTLLNKEIQKGIYDGLIPEAASILNDLGEQEKIVEIAFILNARHALKLAEQFGGKVSVELHTDMANDIEKSVEYAKRYFDICPEQFIIKIPLTPSGYIATRKIRELGIPVNFTLNFSARHNLIASIFSKPSYVNVFLGRQNAYVIDNNLGDGKMVGEKSLLASQRVVAEYSRNNPEPTRQIAASIRDASQIINLAGVDVFTIPVNVARETLNTQDVLFDNRRDRDYPVHMDGKTDLDSVKIETLWQYSEKEHNFAHSLNDNPPVSAKDFVVRAHSAGLQNLFPVFTSEDWDKLSSDGKIPVHERWKDRIKNNELSVDALLNAAGLASFAADQQALDDRIRSILQE